MLNLELLDKHIIECKKYVDAGEESQEVLDQFVGLRNEMENATEDDWTEYNFLTTHLPSDDIDPTLMILKGQLLIETQVRKFIKSRFENQVPFEKASFSAAHCNTIAESFCVNSKETNWLWLQIKELNSIRNKLAHSLDSAKLNKRISNFVSTIDNNQNLESKTLSSAISRLYGMLKGLNDLSVSNKFRVK